jgi:hypothetical protein
MELLMIPVVAAHVMKMVVSGGGALKMTMRAIALTTMRTVIAGGAVTTAAMEARMVSAIVPGMK